MSHFEPIPTHRGTLVAGGGAIAASQPLAVSAGLAVLQNGGTFADAAIAASAVLCVVEAQSSHLGGDGFMIVFDAKTRETVAFNGSGAAPHGANAQTYPGEIPLHGLRAATVPGLVDSWFALHERYGKLPVSDLLAPAIAYAESGFFAGPRLAKVCANYAPVLRARPEMAHALNLHENLAVGERVVQPDLAWTLKQVADGGRAAFYTGAVAARIIAHPETQGNHHFNADDLAAHKTRVLPPIQTTYRHLTIHGQPPPSQGMIFLEELALASGFPLSEMDEATRTHILVEIKKLAFADRNAHLGDPETVDVPVDALLSSAFLEQRHNQIDLSRARPDYHAGSLAGMGTDTTYFLVRDAGGSAVSFIQSVFHVFGAGEVADGTGILFNNRLTGFSLDPASPNYLVPGKRPAHTLNAWLATNTNTGDLAYVGGTPGGHVQVQTNLQVLVELVNGNRTVQEAVEAPRWQHLASVSAVSPEEAGPGVLEMESRIPNAVMENLQKRGHEVRVIGPWAHGSSVQLLAVGKNGESHVGSDPRSDGQAAGL